MDLYIPSARAAEICGWTPEDLRDLRRILQPQIPVSRERGTGRGRAPDQLELEAFIKFADRVEGGLSRATIEKLTRASAPLC